MLRELLKEKNVTQRRIVREAGLSMTALHNYMNGTRELPVSTAKKIAKILEVDWWKLFEEE